jgi:hypothetical protein
MSRSTSLLVNSNNQPTNQPTNRFLINTIDVGGSMQKQQKPDKLSIRTRSVRKSKTNRNRKQHTEIEMYDFGSSEPALGGESDV